jgi:Arc/MetJ-type ribon-helix-helix transcriptional regulator
MTISTRPDPETEALLRSRLLREDLSLSEFVREAIREKLERGDAAATPYSIGEPLFGRHASGDTDRSEQRKALLRERIGAKHRR